MVRMAQTCRLHGSFFQDPKFTWVVIKSAILTWVVIFLKTNVFFNYHMDKIARNCSKIHCFCPKVNKLCHSQRKFCFFLQHLLIFGLKTTYMGGKKIAISYMGGQIFGPRFTWVVKFRFLSGTYAPFIPLSHPPEGP